MIRILRSDFLERSKRPSFLGGVILTLFLAVIGTPQAHSAIAILLLDPNIYRQADNPTWLPISAALMTGFFLPIFGFVLVKNSLETDRQTGVFDIMRSVTFPRLSYCFGKFLSNFLLLLVIWTVVMLGTLGMVVVRFPGETISLGQFLSPFLVLLPGLVLIAAVALFCEAFPLTRGNFGNVIVTFCILMFNAASSDQVIWSKILNPSGSSYLYHTLNQASLNTTGHVLKVLQIIGSHGSAHSGQQSLIIPAVRLDTGDFVAMLLQLGLALGFVLSAAALIFQKWHLRSNHPATSMGNPGQIDEDDLTEQPASLMSQPVSERRFSVISLLKSTIWLLLTELTNWNKGLIVIIWTATIFTPAKVAQQVLLPLIVLLALPLLCALGSRCQSSGVYDWAQTVPSGRRRQRLVELLAGVSLFWLLVLPVALKNLASLPLLVVFGSLGPIIRVPIP
ncbi:hypothetical protein [Lapidilactobacillus luobeiensis]|uniref:hypothetical protein n=1 Tax=Lapidilactobacillus luobeiensis TaxID=2950371 RepID=UPI0021C44D2F|nr:hypothetical protein [Lapidilactobacillus luobeiensis]